MAAAVDIPAPSALAKPAAPHIVDVLIAERAPRLVASPAWPLLRPALYALLDYNKARAMAEAVAPMGGREALDYAARLLDLKIEVRGLQNVPQGGRLIVIANHPTGLADGLAAREALRPVRPDLMFFANADAHRVNPRLDEVFIPVEWVPAKRTRERARLALERSIATLEAEKALIIFPAGRIARTGAHGATVDPPWASSPISLARRSGASILPVHVKGPPPTLFRLFDKVSAELRDITLFHELLNKQGRRFELTIGAPIPARALGADAAAATLRLKRYVERELPAQPDAPFA